MKLREILRAYHPRMVVADGSNPPWRVSEWKREAALMGVRLRDTGEEGSVRVTMNNEQ
jgi:hypothetical protein